MEEADGYGGETGVVEFDAVKVFNLLFLCRSGGGRGEESEGRTVVEVAEEGGQREVGESEQGTGTRLRRNTVSGCLVRLSGCSAGTLSGCWAVEVAFVKINS